MTTTFGQGSNPPNRASRSPSVERTWPRVQLGGVTADLLGMDGVVEVIAERARRPSGGLLGVAAVNLDHVHHFGSGRRAARRERQALVAASSASKVQWMGLVTDRRLARRCREVTGQRCSRISVRRLTTRLLDEAERRQLHVTFLCDSPRRRDELAAALAQRWPGLAEPHVVAVDDHVLDHHITAGQLAESIRQDGVDLLFTALGKARQERWVAEHAAATKAGVCVALGTLTRPLCTAPVERSHRDGMAGRLLHGWWHVNAAARAAHAHLITRRADYRALREDTTVLRAGTSAEAQPRPKGRSRR